MDPPLHLPRRRAGRGHHREHGDSCCWSGRAAGEVVADWAGGTALPGFRPMPGRRTRSVPDCIVIRDGFAACAGCSTWWGRGDGMGDDPRRNCCRQGQARELRAGRGTRPFRRCVSCAVCRRAAARWMTRSNPMELGLDDAYSLSKGCYTGQEVLAKMDTHDSVKRRLVGLEFSGGTLPGNDELLHESDVVGRITSSTLVPGNARAVGLALLAREHATAGLMLRVQGGPEAQVTALPFP